MSTVNITIGPRTYPVVCGDGEEGQIRQLAKLIDERYAKLGDARAPQEAQNLVFTALFLADELAEARKAIASAEPEQAKQGSKKAELRAEIEALREENAKLKAQVADTTKTPDQPANLFDALSADDESIAEHLEALAARAEATADALEGIVPDA